MLAMLALAGCGSSKQTATNAEKSTEMPQESFKRVVSIPCMDFSYDDDNFFRALGTGSSRDKRLVRTLAYRDARQKLNMKIVQSFETQTTFKADVICEELMMSESGVYEGYVVLEIAKDSIKYEKP